MANTVKTTFTAETAPLSKAQSQIQRDMEKYQRDQERREKEITRIFEREARLRGQQEQKSLREAEREYNRIVKERERQEKEITRATLQEIRLREQAQREADADAKFRARELETFRQSIVARQGSGAQPTGVWNRLSGYQKTQLGFQANDIISGLAMGQSPFQILAQQGGQVVQILQQGETASKGIATNLSQASGSVTVLGASAVSLGAIAAAGLVTIGAVYKLSKDIEESAQKRLKRETDITAEYNRQNIALADLAKRIKEAADARSFGGFVGSDDILGLKTGLFSRQQERAALAADVRQKQAYANALVTSLPNLPKSVLENAFPKAEEARLKRLDDEILSIIERLANLKQEQRNDYSNNIFGGVARAIEADRQAVERAAVEAFEKRKKQIEEYKKRLEEAQQAQNQLFDQSFAKSDNPFTQFLGRANSEMRQMLELAKNLSPALREAFVAYAQRQNRNQLFGMRLDAQIEASQLRNRAGEFRQGFNNDLSDPATVQRLINQLFGNLGLPTFSNIGTSQFYNLRQDGSVDWESGSGLYRPIRRTPEQQALIDQRLIREAGNFDPSLLNQGQRNEVASAFEREATRRLNAEKNANDFYTNMNKLISDSGLKVSIGQGTQLDIVLDNQSATNAAIGATEGAVKARYK